MTTHRIALYCEQRSNAHLVLTVSDFIEHQTDYLRISEIVEVTFPLLPEPPLQDRIAALDEQESKARAAYQKQLADISQRKAALLGGDA